MPRPKKPKHFIDLSQIEITDLKAILTNAQKMKRSKYAPAQIFKGLSLAMIFEKRSTRTRMSFEIAMKQLGGHTVVMALDEMQMSDDSSIMDTANILSRYVDGVMMQINDDKTLRLLAKHSKIPVINGLTDYSHPCQIMAALLTIQEKIGAVKGKTIVWFGDYDNVTRTFAQASDMFDFTFVCCVPKELRVDGAKFSNLVYENDPAAAVAAADVVVTDNWISKRQKEDSAKIDLLKPYQINASLLKQSKKEPLIMHCMPIHRGYEITDEVLGYPNCVIYDEAENRLHVQKAILAWSLENAGVTIG